MSICMILKTVKPVCVVEGGRCPWRRWESYAGLKDTQALRGELSADSSLGWETGERKDGGKHCRRSFEQDPKKPARSLSLGPTVAPSVGPRLGSGLCLTPLHKALGDLVTEAQQRPGRR